MDKSYLFFDIECANCFDGIGKMCSFGYVIVNEDFEILDEDDVVMNPETEFDWFLFDPKKGCQLAYSKDYFRQQHNFESYYSGIKKLMEKSGRKILGFSVANDVGFLQSACERYNLPGIQYACYDILCVIEKANGGIHKKLEEWCAFYGVDLTGLVKHKSVDDAKMTMLLTKAFCEKSGITISSLIEQNKGIKLSVEKYIEQREINRHNKENIEKIKNLYGKKARAVLSKKLANKQVAFGFKLSQDTDFALELAELVFKHSGILQRHLKNNGILIYEEEKITPELKTSLSSKNIEVISVSELQEMLTLIR